MAQLRASEILGEIRQSDAANGEAKSFGRNPMLLM
jgi:hypothetical protein